MGNCSMARPHMDSQRPSTRTLVLRGVRDALALPAWVVGLSLFAVGSLAGETGFPAGTAVLSTLLIWAGPAQVIFFAGIAAGTALPAVALAVGLSSIRLLPMAMSLLPLLREQARGTWLQILVAHYVTVTVWVEAQRNLPALLSWLRQRMHRRLRRHELPRLFAGRGAAPAARRGSPVPDAGLLHAVARGRRARGCGLARHRRGLCAYAALVRACRQELRSPADRGCRRHRGVRAAKGEGEATMSAS